MAGEVSLGGYSESLQNHRRLPVGSVDQAPKCQVARAGLKKWHGWVTVRILLIWRCSLLRPAPLQTWMMPRSYFTTRWKIPFRNLSSKKGELILQPSEISKATFAGHIAIRKFLKVKEHNNPSWHFGKYGSLEALLHAIDMMRSLEKGFIINATW